MSWDSNRVSEVTVRPYESGDLEQVCAIWNEVVEAGDAFPETELLDAETGKAFFDRQTATHVAVCEGRVLGLSVLHPNNVGRGAHIANAGYAVSVTSRGKGIGRLLVLDTLETCAARGFLGLQYNAVLDGNHAARHLYAKLGFIHIGTIPNGHRHKDGSYEDTHILFHAV